MEYGSCGNSLRRGLSGRGCFLFLFRFLLRLILADVLRLNDFSRFHLCRLFRFRLDCRLSHFLLLGSRFRRKLHFRFLLLRPGGNGGLSGFLHHFLGLGLRDLVLYRLLRRILA